MNPVLLESLTESTTVNIGLVLGVVVLIVSSVKSASTTKAVADRLEKVVEIHGAKLSAIETNTAAMASDLKHIAEKQNNSVTRAEFDGLERRVTNLEEEVDENA